MAPTVFRGSSLRVSSRCDYEFTISATNSSAQSPYPFRRSTCSKTSSPSSTSASTPSASPTLAPASPSDSSLDILVVPRKITPTKALHLASVIGNAFTVEQIATMANTTPGAMEADLGTEFMRGLRVSSATSLGGEWI